MFNQYSKRSKSAGFSKPADLSDSELRVAAINLLSRREYSLHELFQKLEPRSQNEAQVHSLLEKLVDAGYQNDQRFAESFLRSRINRGLGPMRIQRELKEKGIDLHMIEQIFSDDIDWFQIAYESGSKKSRSLDLADYKQKQKLYRYLAYRGFSTEQILYAIKQLQECI